MAKPSYLDPEVPTIYTDDVTGEIINELPMVNSLNDETGAITNTSFNAIGSYCNGIVSGYTGTTVFTIGSTYTGVIAYRYPPPYASAATTGTWRYMGGAEGYIQGGPQSNMFGALFVRVS